MGRQVGIPDGPISDPYGRAGTIDSDNRQKRVGGRYLGVGQLDIVGHLKPPERDGANRASFPTGRPVAERSVRVSRPLLRVVARCAPFRRARPLFFAGIASGDLGLSARVIHL